MCAYVQASLDFSAPRPSTAVAAVNTHTHTIHALQGWRAGCHLDRSSEAGHIRVMPLACALRTPGYRLCQGCMRGTLAA